MRPRLGWIVSGILLVALVITGVWGYNQYMQNLDYNNRTNNLYEKSFYELVGHVNNIETELSKMMVSSDQGQNIRMLSNVWRQAESAGSNLGQLPLRHMALDKTSTFKSIIRLLPLSNHKGRRGQAHNYRGNGKFKGALQ